MKQEEKVFPTGVLLSSRELAGYQADFARALLPKPAYSVREAKEILQKFFGGGR